MKITELLKRNPGHGLAALAPGNFARAVNNLHKTIKLPSVLLLALLALVGSTFQLQAQFPLASYTNNFATGGNTMPFSGSGSVASWIYWYNTPGGNTAITDDVTTPDPLGGSGAGSLEVSNPFGPGGTQNVFFGTFGNGGSYDFSVEANLLNFSNVTFDVYVAPTNTPNSAGNFGTLGVGIINSSYGYEQFGGGGVTIPGSASNGWVHLSVPIDHTLANLTAVPGIAFDYNNYGGYPTNPLTFWLGNLVVAYSAAPPPPPKLSGQFQPAVSGLNEIATSPGSGGQYDRYQVCSVADTGLGFVDQPSVTYSWTIKSFPQNTGENFQQHFFIVNGAPGQYDQAADYNLADCIFITVQQANNNGLAVMNFRYKTNEPAGNSMLFNGTSPTNTAGDPNGWPVMPFASLNAAAAVGTWSVTFNNQTNVTLTGPGGVSTNFVFDAASAALFADPATLLLGGQPNNPNGDGLAVVYSSFSVAGNDTPYSEAFTNESAINTNFWKDLSNDPNGDVLVPPNAVYWLGWSIPDAGFSLQDSPTLGIATNWNALTPFEIQDNGDREALLLSSELPAGPTAFFQLIQRTATQLQVLWPGETNAPNTPTGKIGTPQSGLSSTSAITLTINAVDSTFHIVNITDDVTDTSDDGGAVFYSSGIPFPLVNGTATDQVYFENAGTWTVTASDTTNTNILSGTSSPITVGP